MVGSDMPQYDNVIRCMRYACWITKATDTHSEHIILMLSHGNNGYANAPQCYVFRTLAVLFLLSYLTFFFALSSSAPYHEHPAPSTSMSLIAICM